MVLLCVICGVCVSKGNEQKENTRPNADHLSRAALWIAPGTPELGVLAFFGEPSFKDDQNCFWYEFSVDSPANEEEKVKKKGYARIYFDEKKIVTNVEVFTLHVKQTSSLYHEGARNRGKLKKMGD